MTKLKHTLYTYVFGLLACIFCCTTAHAQRLSVTTDRDKILLGEQVMLELRLEDVNPRTSDIKEWFVIPDTANHIEVLQRQAIDTVDIGGSNTYVQRIVFTSFDSGRWQLPPFSVTVIDKATGKANVFNRPDLYIDVLPVDVSQLKDYHEMKDIAVVQVKSYTWIIIGAVAIGLLIIWLLWKFVIKKMLAKPKKAVPAAVKGDALQTALQQLAQLKTERPDTPAAVKAWFIRLDDTCRNYTAQTALPRALQLTTDELMVALQAKLANTQLRTDFYQLLRLCDAVKFAKYVPDYAQQQQAVDTAVDCIRQTDQTLKSQQTTTATAHVN
ncbi:hypothetical protein [Deminuibacter soli]|uniref:Protein BatD n=1 Tax=Deminuibacter soli TaxID=2291815 RepID=A0A3E1NFC4_9BACT|nr:hypothetical protein [Deminuibacter soli]RFM26577.1 hypothetical protein DXN05_18550 [Deminuibacter soli]